MKGIYSLILIFFLDFFVYGNAVPKKDWNSEEITNLMTLLMNYGEEKLQKHNKNNTNKYSQAKQYLVVSVLSESEMTDSRNWQHIPESITKDNARVDFILNSKEYNKVQFETKKPVHGEVLMLLEREDLPKMINNLKNTHNNTYPYVVLYSHYIPCCDVKGVGYSCSKELANAAMSNPDKYTMLVGFDISFHGTNKNRSLAFMEIGGIKLFQMNDTIFESVSTDYKLPNETELFLQELFYKCLDIMPVSDNKSCVADNPDDKKKILSIYVNNAVHKCTTLLKSYQGNLTDLNTIQIRNCLYKHVEDTIGGDCPNCGAEETRNLVKLCVLHASEFGTNIGRPSNIHDPYLPEWEKGPADWVSLYEGYNIKADVNRPKVLCLKKPNDIKTLCTVQLSIPKKEKIQSFLHKVQKIWNDTNNNNEK